MATEFTAKNRALYERGKLEIAQETAQRDQLESQYRDAKGRRKTALGKELAAADHSLFESQTSHEVYTEGLIWKGDLPEDMRRPPVEPKDTRTNFEKWGSPNFSPSSMAAMPWLEQRRVGLSAEAVSAPATTNPGNSPRSREPVPEKSVEPAPNTRATPSVRKVLPIGSPDVIRAVDSGAGGSREDEGVLGAASRGFVKGALTGVQAELSARNARELVSSLAGDEAPTQGKTPSEDTAEGARGVVMHPDHLAALEAHESRQPARPPAPETRQPPSLDVIDVIQGNPTPDVVMHPGHIAGLKALEGNGDDGLESGGAGYGR